MRKVVLAAILIGSFTLAGGATRAVHAQGGLPCTPIANANGAATCTVTFKDAQQVITPANGGSNPCSAVPEPAYIDITYNGVAHGAVNQNGVWSTFTSTGTFFLHPVDTSLPSYMGHFTMWDGGSINPEISVFTSTFTVHGVGSDGSTLMFHDTAHMSVSDSGVTISFDKPMCG